MKSINQIIKTGNKYRNVFISIYEKYKEILENPYLIENSQLFFYKNRVYIKTYGNLVYSEINNYKLTLTKAFIDINPDIEKVEIKNFKSKKEKEEKKEEKIHIRRNKEELEKQIDKNIELIEDEKMKKHLRNLKKAYLSSDDAYKLKCKRCNNPATYFLNGICFNCLYEEKEEKFNIACNQILKNKLHNNNTRVYQNAREFLASDIFYQILNMQETKKRQYDNKKLRDKMIEYARIKGATNDMEIIKIEIQKLIRIIERKLNEK